MGVFDSLRPRKSIEELSEEKEHNEAEISLLQQEVIKKELKKRSIELSTFKDENGKTDWQRAWHWVKTQLGK